MSSTVSIHWCSLVPRETDSVRVGLRELSEKLKDRYPDLPEVEICELTPTERNDLPEFLERQCGGGSDARSVGSLDNKLVFVYCDRDEPLAIKAREDDPERWGAAVLGNWALAWTPNNKYLLWHEAMHLLYAHDCYERHNCDEPQGRCIMQYVPTEKNCGSDLYLCSGNLRCAREMSLLA